MMIDCSFTYLLKFHYYYYDYYYYAMFIQYNTYISDPECRNRLNNCLRHNVHKSLTNDQRICLDVVDIPITSIDTIRQSYIYMTNSRNCKLLRLLTHFCTTAYVRTGRRKMDCKIDGEQTAGPDRAKSRPRHNGFSTGG